MVQIVFLLLKSALLGVDDLGFRRVACGLAFEIEGWPWQLGEAALIITGCCI